MIFDKNNQLNEVGQRLRKYIDEYEDTPNWGGPTKYPDPLNIADMKVLLKLTEQHTTSVQPKDITEVLLWEAGRDAALKEVVDIARLSPHLVNVIFIPAIEGISQTLEAPFIDSPIPLEIINTPPTESLPFTAVDTKI